MLNATPLILPTDKPLTSCSASSVVGWEERYPFFSCKINVVASSFLGAISWEIDSSRYNVPVHGTKIK